MKKIHVNYFRTMKLNLVLEKHSKNVSYGLFLFGGKYRINYYIFIRTPNPHFMWCKRRKIDYCEKIPRKLDCLSYRKSFIYVVNLSI